MFLRVITDLGIRYFEVVKMDEDTDLNDMIGRVIKRTVEFQVQALPEEEREKVLRKFSEVLVQEISADEYLNAIGDGHPINTVGDYGPFYKIELGKKAPEVVTVPDCFKGKLN